jgi:uncharacterized protein YbjT (DUF2867 family)
VQVISLNEIAEFATLAVEQRDALQGKRINLASDELTLNEMTRHIAGALDKKLTYQAIPLDVVRKQSEDLGKMYDWFNRVGYSAEVEKLRQEYPQVHWQTFEEWAIAQHWSQVIPAAPKT